MTHILCVHPSGAESSLNDVLRGAPERRQDVESTTVVAVECTD
jgi:hypothetical protein